MEILKVETAELAFEPEMRCQGMCSGSCSCPTGHCRCNTPVSEPCGNDLPSSDSCEFSQA